MKYLAAFLIAIGLIAHNPASAETLEFLESKETRVEQCYMAEKRGIPLGASETLKRAGKPIKESFLVSRGDFGVWYGTGDASLWRIYEFYNEPKPLFGFDVSCWYRPLEE